MLICIHYGPLPKPNNEKHQGTCTEHTSMLFWDRPYQSKVIRYYGNNHVGFQFYISHAHKCISVPLMVLLFLVLCCKRDNFINISCLWSDSGVLEHHSWNTFSKLIWCEKICGYQPQEPQGNCELCKVEDLLFVWRYYISRSKMDILLYKKVPDISACFRVVYTGQTPSANSNTMNFKFLSNLVMESSKYRRIYCNFYSKQNLAHRSP